MTRRDTTTDTDSDRNRRTDRRPVEEHERAHYSAAEVYAALDCPYPGTADEREASNSAAIALHSRRERDEQSSRKTTDGRNGGGSPVSSPTSGIKLPLARSTAAVRRRAWFSGFVSGASAETDENDEYDRYNHGGTMKATSYHDRDEQRDDRDRDHEDRLMTDGGTGETRDPEGLDLTLGARVVDRDADDPNPAVVVALPEEPAYARTIDALDGQSVADVNEDYPASGRVATVAYAGDLDRVLDVWRDADPDALAAICDDHEVRTYDFPTARLRPADEFSKGGDAR